jgi:hypothetical protein
VLSPDLRRPAIPRASALGDVARSWAAARRPAGLVLTCCRIDPETIRDAAAAGLGLLVYVVRDREGVRLEGRCYGGRPERTKGGTRDDS